MNACHWFYRSSTAPLLLIGCVSYPKQADTRAVTVATYEMSDKASYTLIFDTLRQHGIEAVGVSSGGWVEVEVVESRAAEARAILSGLSRKELSFRLIDR